MCESSTTVPTVTVNWPRHARHLYRRKPLRRQRRDPGSAGSSRPLYGRSIAKTRPSFLQFEHVPLAYRSIFTPRESMAIAGSTSSGLMAVLLAMHSRQSARLMMSAAIADDIGSPCMLQFSPVNRTGLSGVRFNVRQIGRNRVSQPGAQMQSQSESLQVGVKSARFWVCERANCQGKGVHRSPPDIHQKHPRRIYPMARCGNTAVTGNNDSTVLSCRTEMHIPTVPRDEGACT